MVEYAGFDVVAQVHRETLADLASSEPVAGGHLFGGPFVTAFDGVLAASGLALAVPYRLSATVEARLSARVGEGAATVRLELTHGVLSLGGPAAGDPVSGLVIGVDVVVPIRFAYLPGLDPQGGWTPQTAAAAGSGATVPAPGSVGVRAAFEECEAVVSLDPTAPGTQAAASHLGPTGLPRLERGLAIGLKAFLSNAANPARPLGAFTLRVVQGVSSSSLDTLAHMPVPCWLDADTLACFGTYRADGPTSVPAIAVGSSDLAQEPTEFLAPGRPVGGHTLLPTRPAMLSISTDALRRLVFCPAVRQHLARELAHLGYREEWIAARRTSGEGAATAGERAAWLTAFQGYQETLGPAAAHRRATADLAAWTTRRLVDAHLDSVEGAATVAAHTPADCGAGPVSVAVAVPDLPDPTLVVERVWFHSTEGALLVSMRGHADPPLCGRLAAEVDLRVRLVVASDRRRVEGVPEVVRQHTDTSRTALCEALVALLVMPAAGPAWGVFAGLLSGHVARSLSASLAADAIAEALGAGLDNVATDLPASDTVRLRDVRIDAEGVTVVALVARAVLQLNDARPVVSVGVEQVSRTRDRTAPTVRGRFLKHRSCVDGEPREFAYEVRAYAETWRLRLTHRNLSAPLRIESATLALGDPADRRVADSGLLEPQWRTPVPLVDGSVVLPGPATVLEMPEGDDVVAPEVTVQLASDPEGWTLTARGQGELVVRLAAEVVDAVGRRLPVLAIVAVRGREVHFGEDMAEEQAVCLDRLRRELDELPPLVQEVDLPPWRKTWDPAEWRVPEIRRGLSIADVRAVVELSRRRLGGGP